MVARRAAPAFRPSAPETPGHAPSRVQASALLVGVVLLALVVSVVSYLVKPNRAHSFNLFYGSLFINDNTEPVAVDLASGKPSVRLNNAWRNVSAKSSGDLDLVPLDGDNTLMLDPVTGAFNMIDSTGFVVTSRPRGVRLPTRPGTGRTTAVPSAESAYLYQSSATTSWVYLVSQLTVQNAHGRNAKARAYATLPAPVADVSAPAAAGNGALWMLTDSRAGVAPTQQVHKLTELTVPSGSNIGATLHSVPRGTVTGEAALESATLNTDGSGSDVTAMASSSAVRVFGPDGSQSVPVHVNGTVTDILAASNAEGRFWFLYQTTSGWTQVSVPTNDPADPTVTPLTTISPGARLITPAASDGRLYTMDTAGKGDLWRLDADGNAARIPGAPSYPYLAKVENLSLGQSEVIARGSRVIFNSRANDQAEVVFTDGSSPPRTIDKRSAVEVDPTGETTLASDKVRTHKHGKTHTPKPSKQKHTLPTQPVNPHIDCKTTHQTPHIPQVTVQSAASRSVTLVWRYPVLGPQDCRPSTYTVSTQLEGSDAPAPPGQQKVNGQNGITLTGLFPDTDYLITVTAYLTPNDHTAAPPVHVHTTVEGPAAPTNVQTTVDSSGNWRVTWHSCGGVQSGCVPVADWQIVPKFCDGLGVSNSPQTVTEVGDPTLHLWQYTYHGSNALLGRGMSFSVQGVGTTGTVGDTAADSSCSYSWSTPVKSAITVQASKPAQTNNSSAVTTTTVGVTFAGNATHDLGGIGGQLSYALMSGSHVVARSGPTTHTTVKLTGVTAGKQYQVVVTAIPPRHPDAAVQLDAVDVEPTFAAWPDPTVDAGFANTSANKGTLTVVPSLGGADTQGETFDLTSNSYLQCGNAVFPIDASQYPKSADVRPDHALVFRSVDRFSYYGDCTVSLQLTQHAGTATNPPLYGAGPSKTVTASVSIAPPTSTAVANDFSAKFVSGTAFGQPQIALTYRKQRDPLSLTSNWSLTADNGTQSCGSSTTAPNPTTVINVGPLCVLGTGTNTVQVSYSYFGQTESFTVPVRGSAPAPINSARMNFQGTWSGTANNPTITVEYCKSGCSHPYDQATLNQLNWSYTVTSSISPGDCMAQNTTTPPQDNSSYGPDLQIDYNTCPPTTGGGSTPPGGNPPPPLQTATYTLTVHYTDPSYNTSHDYTVTVDGTPPQ